MKKEILAFLLKDLLNFLKSVQSSDVNYRNDRELDRLIERLNKYIYN